MLSEKGWGISWVVVFWFGAEIHGACRDFHVFAIEKGEWENPVAQFGSAGEFRIHPSAAVLDGVTGSVVLDEGITEPVPKAGAAIKEPAQIPAKNRGLPILEKRVVSLAQKHAGQTKQEKDADPFGRVLEHRSHDQVLTALDIQQETIRGSVPNNRMWGIIATARPASAFKEHGLDAYFVSLHFTSEEVAYSMIIVSW